MPDQLLGFDVGGSSVKGGRVDLASAGLDGELLSARTPQPATPQAVLSVIATLAQRLAPTSGPVGVALPSVVKHGVVRTAANIDDSWIGVDGAALAQQVLGRPAHVLNDADAAGLAEMHWGAGRGERGPVVMLTFGTGIGSALFIDGRLFPNTELGHLEIRGNDAEKLASAHVRTQLALDWPAWIVRVNEYLAHMEALLWPDLFILGGAVTEHFDEFAPLIRSQAPVRCAQFGGQSGVVGAALAASL
jgi:polyphosphate glucokinase